MFICEKHGDLKTEWCDSCEKLVDCDCRDIETVRFKDLIFDCEAGELCITLYLKVCETCGDIKEIEW